MTGGTSAVLLTVAAAVVAVWAATAGAKAGRATERAVSQAARGGSIAGRALLIAAVIVGVQWLVVRNTADPLTVAAVLAVPGLVTGIVVARVLAGPDLVRVSRRSLR
jgi:hypothetical protein